MNSNLTFKQDTIGSKETLDAINSVIDSLPDKEYRFIGNIDNLDERYILCETAWMKEKCIGFILFTRIDRLNGEGESLYPPSLKNIPCPMPNIFIVTSKEGRGKHLSHKLIEKAIPYLRESGYEFMCWASWYENVSSIQAAISNGFEEVGVSKYPEEEDGTHIFIREI